MQTQHSSPGVTEHTQTHTHGDFLDRLARYEAAVKRIYEDKDITRESVAELSSAKQSMSDISRIAKAAFDEKFTPPEGDRIFGKALKDWATAMMENRGVTRAVARDRIMAAIKLMNAREYPALTPNVVREYVVEGCESGRIQSSEPNFTEVERTAHDHLLPVSGDLSDVHSVLNMLDHLPEGSH
jgi:hypothetical protein